jgi:hypothetical protein
MPMELGENWIVAEKEIGTGRETDCGIVNAIGMS